MYVCVVVYQLRMGGVPSGAMIPMPGSGDLELGPIPSPGSCSFVYVCLFCLLCVCACC